jgi:hypothetical protein
MRAGGYEAIFLGVAEGKLFGEERFVATGAEYGDYMCGEGGL